MKKTILTAMLTITLLLTVTLPLSAAETTATRTTTGSKLLAITFDDGPGNYTASLLDALAKRNVKATFFVVGNRVSSYSAIVKREYEEGHQMANHSWDHANLTSLGYASFTSELSKTQNAISSAVGHDVGQLVLRPPGGNYNANVKAWANCPLILWSIDPKDWKDRNATTVKNRIVSQAKDGAIILVHDLYATSVQGAIAAIDELQAQGYTFVTVNELFRRKGITLQNGAVYMSAPSNGIDLGPLDPYAYDETKLSQHWAYTYITYVKEHGLMNGFREDLFGPNYPMTRGMFVTVISRLSGETVTGYENTFSDVNNNTWYTEAVAWAAAKGIVQGVGNSLFSPEAYVTREQACVIMANYLAYCGLGPAVTTPLTFDDTDQISAWAKQGVTVMVGKGIINGKGNNLLDPKAYATRAEAAVILTKFDQLFPNTLTAQHWRF
ncbi:MAG TPA: S-layer homology domain-containing protein [Clostridiales bacterium]|nr:S-layer homology domain-containing protein [Clostridiales bacterium]